jgi:hypothetical protein
MTLFLNTTDFYYVSFTLVDGKKTTTKKYKISLQTEKVLNFLDQFLSKEIKKDFSKLSEIYVLVGEGSFTGIRVGLSIALAFNTVLNVPIFAIDKKNLPKDLLFLGKAKKKKITASLEAVYASNPKITKAKKKILRNT